LIVDDDRNILTSLEIYLREAGAEVLIARTGREGVEIYKNEKPDVVLLDLKLPDMNGLEVLEAILAVGRRTYVVIVTAYATIDTAVKAIKSGAFDYLAKPFTPAQIGHLLERIEKIRGLENEVETLRGIVREGDFLTRSPRMRQVLRMARQVAESTAGVLITGESGTGKGLLARMIHDWSPRADAPFVTVNCAGLQENLLESDLFGHVKGAFTGALKDKIGKIETANGGTVFLDEVSELSPTIQAKLLHFLQQHEFERLGDAAPRRVDVRVISATNRDLDELVKEKAFRQDLYFRLNVVEIFLPPLRERPEDVRIIAEHYLERFSRINRKKTLRLSDEALEVLQQYPWPGNIRELLNAIERGTVLTGGELLETADLPLHVARHQPETHAPGELKSLNELEKEHIRQVLLRAPSLEEAARILGIDPATLWRKRKKYHLD
jgi:NtrC-family two-component system response regulator AlgB